MGASGNGCPFLFFAPLTSTIFVQMGDLREGASTKIASATTKIASMPTKFASPSTQFEPMGVLREGASAEIASATTKIASMPGSIRVYSISCVRVKIAGHGADSFLKGPYKKVPPTCGRRNL